MLKKHKPSYCVYPIHDISIRNAISVINTDFPIIQTL